MIIKRTEDSMSRPFHSEHLLNLCIEEIDNYELMVASYIAAYIFVEVTVLCKYSKYINTSSYTLMKFIFNHKCSSCNDRK